MVRVTAESREERVEGAALGSDANGENDAAVGRRQGLISIAAATMSFAGMSLGQADALEDNDCLECGGSGVVVCKSPPFLNSTPIPTLSQDQAAHFLSTTTCFADIFFLLTSTVPST